MKIVGIAKDYMGFPKFITVNENDFVQGQVVDLYYDEFDDGTLAVISGFAGVPIKAYDDPTDSEVSSLYTDFVSGVFGEASAVVVLEGGAYAYFDADEPTAVLNSYTMQIIADDLTSSVAVDEETIDEYRDVTGEAE